MHDKSVTTGRVVSISGTDIDTDRIIPARFMKHLTFEHLGTHVFEDDRADLRRKGEVHPFDDPRNAGARILLVGRNFGCGSSREHAPQALHRWGIDAVIGESFGEIFAGNCVSVGMPCVRASAEVIAELRELADENPERVFSLDLETCSIATDNHRYPFEIADGPRRQFREGSWDPVGMLLSARPDIERVEGKVPAYFKRT